MSHFKQPKLAFIQVTHHTGLYFLKKWYAEATPYTDQYSTSKFDILQVQGEPTNHTDPFVLPLNTSPFATTKY